MRVIVVGAGISGLGAVPAALAALVPVRVGVTVERVAGAAAARCGGLHLRRLLGLPDHRDRAGRRPAGSPRDSG